MSHGAARSLHSRSPRMATGARWASAPWIALALVYALVSLPLIDAHVALAGYADLWVALTLGLATLAWTRWLIRREPSQLALALGLALCLPAIKLEGTVWLLVFAAIVVLDLVPRALAMACGARDGRRDR